MFKDQQWLNPRLSAFTQSLSPLSTLGPLTLITWFFFTMVKNHCICSCMWRQHEILERFTYLGSERKCQEVLRQISLAYAIMGFLKTSTSHFQHQTKHQLKKMSRSLRQIGLAYAVKGSLNKGTSRFQHLLRKTDQNLRVICAPCITVGLWDMVTWKDKSTALILCAFGESLAITGMTFSQTSGYSSKLTWGLLPAEFNANSAYMSMWHIFQGQTHPLDCICRGQACMEEASDIHKPRGWSKQYVLVGDPQNEKELPSIVNYCKWLRIMTTVVH